MALLVALVVLVAPMVAVKADFYVFTQCNCTV